MACSEEGAVDPTAARAIIGSSSYCPLFEVVRLFGVQEPELWLKRPETRYVKSDDLYIAYQVLGDGPFDLLFVLEDTRGRETLSGL
jgi:hypothetical protein